MDWRFLLVFAVFCAACIIGVWGSWRLVKRQEDRNWNTMEIVAKKHEQYIELYQRGFELFSNRVDTKFEKHLTALTSVQDVAAEAMRQVLAAWARIEDESKQAAREREERARLQEQMSFQQELIRELKRTQELNLHDLRNAIEQHRQGATG